MRELGRLRLIIVTPQHAGAEFASLISMPADATILEPHDLAPDWRPDAESPASAEARNRVVEGFDAAAQPIAVGLGSAASLWIVEALLEAGAQGLFLYANPADAIARSLLTGAELDAAIADWRRETAPLLAIFRRYRRNCALVDAGQALRAPDDFQYFCADRFGLPPGRPDEKRAPPLAPNAMSVIVARRLVAQSPDAVALGEELEASSQKIGGLVHADLDAMAVAELKAHQAHGYEAERAREEIELLRAHLHLVQSQLETRFRKVETETIAAAEKRVAALKAQAGAQAAEIAQMKSSASWRLTTPLRAVSRLWRNRIVSVFRVRREVAIVRASPLFDADWYIHQNKDVAEAGLDPAVHYVRSGGVEGRAPGPGFDGAAYLAANPDIAGRGANPLVHYLRFGKAEGRPLNPSPGGAASRAA